MSPRPRMTMKPDPTLRERLAARLFGDPGAVPASLPGQASGDINPRRRRRIRRLVFQRDGFTCQQCGLVFTCPEGWDGTTRVWHDDGATELTVDHMVPTSQGGRFTVENLRALCAPCNNARGDQPLRTWPLPALLTTFKDGDEHGWDVEFAYLDGIHADKLAALEQSIATYGIREPVLIGSDGRIWDGHHRLRVAHRLGFATVPVRFWWEA